MCQITNLTCPTCQPPPPSPRPTFSTTPTPSSSTDSLDRFLTSSGMHYFPPPFPPRVITIACTPGVQPVPCANSKEITALSNCEVCDRTYREQLDGAESTEERSAVIAAWAERRSASWRENQRGEVERVRRRWREMGGREGEDGTVYW